MGHLWKEFLRGIWRENPVFVMLIGMCPTLAVTTTATNGMAMGLAAGFVLLASSMIISLFRNAIPKKVRIPSYIIIIATFVTIVDMVMAAAVPQIHKVLGLFIPLIVVNCLIMGRAEAYASRKPVVDSIFDALGMGLGFTWALTLLGSVREILGMGSVFGISVLPATTTPWVIALLPPGAFLTMGIMVGLLNQLNARLALRTQKSGSTSTAAKTASA